MTITPSTLPAPWNTDWKVRRNGETGEVAASCPIGDRIFTIHFDPLTEAEFADVERLFTHARKADVGLRPAP